MALVVLTDINAVLLLVWGFRIAEAFNASATYVTDPGFHAPLRA